MKGDRNMQTNYPRYDLEKIYDEINAEMVVKEYGIETFSKGKNTYILCPGHVSRLGKEDVHFGNCILKEKGYYCFACQEYVSIFEMIMELEHCNKFHAIEIAADICGGRELYRVSGAGIKDNKKKSLNMRDLKFIGLCNNSNRAYIPISSIEKDESNDKNLHIMRRSILDLSRAYPDVKAEHIQIIKAKFPTMNLLKEENYNLYCHLIKQKALETIFRYAGLIEQYVFKKEELENYQSVLDRKTLHYIFFKNILKAYQIYLNFTN